MKVSSAFKKIAKLKHKNKVVQGSQGAGKTYSILQRWILMALLSETKQHCTIVSATFPHLVQGALKDFLSICENDNIPVAGTKKPAIFYVGLWTFEFISVDKEGKGLGARRDRLYINEANRIPWKIARQLISRTHKECIFDFNPVQRFWAHTEFSDVGDAAFIKLTYKDNEYLPKSEISSIEKHSPWGSRPDANYWRVYGLGEIGFTEGQIYNYKKFSKLPDKELQTTYGIDFGWEDPMVCVKVDIDHKEQKVYWTQIFYKSHAKHSEMVAEIKKTYKGETCFCDHSPREIMLLRSLGLRTMQADKKNGLESDIRAVKQYELYIHEESEEIITEIDSYIYQVKVINGKEEIVPYPKPDQKDHAMDGGRYGTTGAINFKR